MTRLSTTKLIVAAWGLIIWGYGIRNEDATLQWVGIAMLATAVLLRFIRRRDDR